MATLIKTPAANWDLEYYSNDTFNNSITVSDAAGDPVDLSGKTLIMQVKKRKSDAQSIALIDISTASEITVGGEDNNIITFSGEYNLPERTYFYDLRNTTDNITIMYGEFDVIPDVSRIDE